MEINCLSCGHSVDIGDAYDDFEGEVKCFVCDGILHIRTEQGQIKSVELARLQEAGWPPAAETADQPGVPVARSAPQALRS